ncbi:hypothetical protein [Rhizobium nepotum]|uniref:hypothetical protein n=1 Tax=Rhizobium nepotum TaxID=1035271 RepID=UPI003CF27E51
MASTTWLETLAQAHEHSRRHRPTEENSQHSDHAVSGDIGKLQSFFAWQERETIAPRLDQIEDENRKSSRACLSPGSRSRP